MIIYRPAVQSDLVQVIQLLCEIMEHHGVTPPNAADLETCVTEIFDSKDHLFLMAEEDGGSIGMCALLFSLSTWSAAPVCEIQDLIVTSIRRGENVGRGLLQAARKIASERGCTRMFLLAECWNLDAQAFYRRLDLTEKTCLDFECDLRTQLP